MKQIFTFLLVAAMALSGIAQNVGEAAKDFTLKDLSNMDYMLSSNKGKVILVFLVGYNCSLCKASAPSVKSQLVDAFNGNDKFQAIVIDVWDGNTSSVQGFQSSTNLNNATFLQKGSGVAADWSTTYDRVFVVDKQGKIAFRGTRAAQSDVSSAKSAIQTALNEVVTSVTLLEDQDGYALGQNYPNPVTNRTRIHFKVKEAGEVNVTVFDISGKAVATPVNRFYNAGDYDVEFNRNSLRDGVYFYRMTSGDFSETKRMVLK